MTLHRLCVFCLLRAFVYDLIVLLLFNLLDLFVVSDMLSVTPSAGKCLTSRTLTIMNSRKFLDILIHLLM